jgi:hypothetical protein
VGSVTELLDEAASQFINDIGGAWLWIVDWGSQRAQLGWNTGNLIDLTMSGALNTYTGQADVAGQGSILTAANAPGSIWYPTLPNVQAEPAVEGRFAYSWQSSDAAQSICAADPIDAYNIVTRIDNTAGDRAQQIQFYDFFVNHIADGDRFSWFAEYLDDWEDATLLALDEMDALEFIRVVPRSSRYFDVALPCLNVRTGMV